MQKTGKHTARKNAPAYPTQDIQPLARYGCHTQIDNAVFDIIMPKISAPATKVLFYILRHVPKRDSFSTNQIAAGIGAETNEAAVKAIDELRDETIFGSPILVKTLDGHWCLNRQFSLEENER